MKWYDRLDLWLSRHWLALFNIACGVFVLTPYLAPVFMRLGLTGLGDRLYFLYALFGHQLPQRSFFLFGPRLMYSLPEITALTHSLEPLALKQFTGSAELGWKVAYSDRLAAVYGSFWIAALVFGLIRPRLRFLPFWGLALFCLPMFVDGLTHLISDVLVNQQFGAGFRDLNVWLVQLTNNAWPATFYAGDGLGSFNSLARLLSGVLCGVGLAWFLLPFADAVFAGRRVELEAERPG